MLQIDIDFDSQIPLYLQIVSHIESRIQSGALVHGDELPTESFFDFFYGISPIVIKQAYALLKSKGLIQTNRGTKATVFSRVKLLVNYHMYHMYNQNLFKNRMHLLFRKKRSATPVELLSFQKELFFILETKRVYYHEKLPYYLQVNVMDYDLNHPIHESPNNQGMLSSIKSYYGLEPDHIEALYHPIKANIHLAEFFNIKPNAPLHYFKYTHFINQKIVGINYHYFPADFVDLVRFD